MARDRWVETLLVALFALIVCFQLFVPPYLGMANNGDYSRLIGRYSLGPAAKDPSDEYVYFATRWIFDSSYHWISDNFSSELIPISVALLANWLSYSYQFDIRFLGVVHALLWIGCFFALMVALRPLPGWRRWTVAGVALFVFTDANYVAFCHSFYMDAAAFLFLAWAVVLWLLVITRVRPTLATYVWFCVASALCVMSKSQHAPLGLPMLLLASIAAMRFEEKKRKAAALALALIIPLAAWAEYHFMPASDARMPQYALVFRKILESSPTVDADLRELRLGPEYMAYVGKERPALADPLAEELWWEGFLQRASRGRVLLFHLRHPRRTLSMMYWDLRVRGADRRMNIIGKYERQSGLPPSSQAQSFGWWTASRSLLFRYAAWHIVLSFAAALWISIRIAIRDWGATASRVALLCAVLAVMAVMEFAISSLSDVGETERHLFLFHVLTDFTILCGVAWLVRRVGSARAGHPGQLPNPTHPAQS